MPAPTTPIYLDHHATTPVAPVVAEAMIPYLTEHFGNAGSKQHSVGMRARAAVDLAREQVAEHLGATPREILFTSGATESDNLAILGVMRRAMREGRGRHLVTVATEHKAVLDPARWLAEREGAELTVLSPDPLGRITPEQLEASLRDDTVLVSVMLANNEIGVVQPIAALAEVAHEAGALLHTDAAQAIGKLPVDVGALGADLVSLTGHKAYGPKGVGALYIRRGRPRIKLDPLQVGGGQERGLRSGTLPVPLLVGLGRAYALAGEHLEQGEPARLAALRDRLWEGLSRIEGVHLNGHPTERLPHNLNVSFDGVRSAALMMSIRPIACSSGSACSTSDPRPSHVLTALGHDADRANAALRFGLGRDTTEAQIDQAVDLVTTKVAELRAMGATA